MTDVAAAYGMAGRPMWFVFAALFVIVMARSHLFYWLGRGVYTGAAHLADGLQVRQVRDVRPDLHDVGERRAVRLEDDPEVLEDLARLRA